MDQIDQLWKSILLDAACEIVGYRAHLKKYSYLFVRSAPTIPSLPCFGLISSAVGEQWALRFADRVIELERDMDSVMRLIDPAHIKALRSMARRAFRMNEEILISEDGITWRRECVDPDTEVDKNLFTLRKEQLHIPKWAMREIRRLFTEKAGKA